jgi:hypothetical protein
MFMVAPANMVLFSALLSKLPLLLLLAAKAVELRYAASAPLELQAVRIEHAAMKGIAVHKLLMSRRAPSGVYVKLAQVAAVGVLTHGCAAAGPATTDSAMCIPICMSCAPTKTAKLPKITKNI